MALSQLLDVPFGGLASREVQIRVPFEAAITAQDCFLDRDQIEGRCAYRDCLNSTVGAIGASPQLLDRFRPSAASARVVACSGGGVYVVTDPTTLTSSDGAASLVSSPFGASGNLSGAQLNDNYYLGTDESNVAWQRLKSDYTIQSLLSIAQGAKPVLSAFNTLAWTLFNGLAAPTITGTANYSTSGIPGGATNWKSVTATGANDDPATGITVRFKLAANLDATGYDFLAISMASGATVGHGNTDGQIDVYVAEDVAGSPGTFVLAGSTWEPSPHAGPNLSYFPLIGLPTAQRSAVRYIKFILSGQGGGKFALYGYCFLPGPPLNRPEHYFVDFYDSTTLQASPLTEELDVTIKDSDVILPPYVDMWLENDSFQTTSGNDDMLSSSNRRVFNRLAGKPMPTKADIGAVVTVTGTSPAGYTGTLQPRLWKDTSTGRRQVNTAALIAASTAYSLTDAGGLTTLYNTLYKAGGAPPRCNAMAAYAGRIIAGYQGTIYVSNYTPPGTTSNPIPQFPPVPQEVADGYQFDLASKAEQVSSITGWPADAVYILTNQALRVMFDLDAPLFGAVPIIHVYAKGECGRNAHGFFDDRFFWCSFDGVYMGQGRSAPVELSKGIRQYIKDTFAPGGSVRMGYQDRCLFVFNGRLGLRYNFTTNRWSPMTLTDNVWAVCSWADPPSSTGTITVNTLANDTFVGTNNDTIVGRVSDSGQTWVRHAYVNTNTDFAILTNRMDMNANGAKEKYYYLNYTPASADTPVQVDFVVRSAGGEGTPNAALGVIYRVSTGANTMMMVGFSGSGAGYKTSTASRWWIAKLVAGTWTQLATYNSGQANLTLGGTYTIQIQPVGNVHTVYLNGAQIMQVTDSAVPATGPAGIFGFQNGGDTEHPGAFDNFQVLGSTTVATASGGTGESMWLFAASRRIHRWQSTCLRDGQVGTDATTGTAIPDWSFSTGFQQFGQPHRVTRIYADVSGDAGRLYVSKSMDDEPESAIGLPVGENVIDSPPDVRSYHLRLRLEGTNDTKVRILKWSLESIDSTAA